MGSGTASRVAYRAAVDTHTKSGQSATHRGEEVARTTGRLDKLVDPAEYGVVRPSRIRLAEVKDSDLLEVTVGTPVPIEYRLDTTGSMGNNVDRALQVLPEICDLAFAALPGCDPFYCASIFGDLVDVVQATGMRGFPLCRGQFEAESGKMVNQLTLMHPNRDGGGNGGEDPHYGLFGAAYLTAAYINQIGMKRFDFTTTDEPMHEGVDSDSLVRIYGPKVFDKTVENKHPIDRENLPDNRQIVKDLLSEAHAFALLVMRRGDDPSLRAHWAEFYGKDRVIIMPEIELLPHVMATVIGLTEGTFDLQSAGEFLAEHELDKATARRVVEAVAHIPLGAQCALPNFKRMPKKGDLFASKTDLWPVEADKLLDKGDAKKSAGAPKGGWKL